MSEIFYKEQLSQQRAKSFLSKIDTKSPKECWNWKAGKDKIGYGRFFLNGKQQYAHRVSYFLSKGLIPDGMVVMHKCNNPSCVNPTHLELGTQLENIQQRDLSGRGNFSKGENHYLKKNPSLSTKGCNHGQSKLKNDDVLMIRKLSLDGERSKAIANLFNVSAKTIQRITSLKSWTHLA